MSAAPLRLVHTEQPRSAPPPPAAPQRRVRKPLGQVLLDMGALSKDNLEIATGLQRTQDARLGDILLANGFVRHTDLYAALARQFNCAIADLQATPPDVRLIDDLGADFCIRNRVVPWKKSGPEPLSFARAPMNSTF